MTGLGRRAMGVLAAGAVAIGGAPGEAIAQAPTPLERRAEDVARLFDPAPDAMDRLFAPEFLAAVPPAQLSGIVAQFAGQFGTVTRTRRLAGGDAWHGKFEYAFTKGFVVKADLVVAEQAPHLVTGLLLGNGTPQAASLHEVARAFASLPGQATFAVARLGAQGPEFVGSHAPDRALAIGSAFKLWILGALIEDVQAGKRRWDQVVPLTEAARSLPGGRLQDWPVGAPVTLHTLASLMISESDNTATDLLLQLLGRERVEATMAKMGVVDPARNRPMLTTLEMFKIKAGADPQGPAIWAGLDEAGRRKHRAAIAAMPRDAVKSWASPRALDTLEWFASAADLARMAAWLRDHSAAGEAAKARGVLAINPGLRFDAEAWPYVGYKGGSEPGVLAAAFLLRAKDGAWWSITGAWNDPAAAVASERFFGLIERAAELAAEAPEAQPENR